MVGLDLEEEEEYKVTALKLLHKRTEKEEKLLLDLIQRAEKKKGREFLFGDFPRHPKLTNFSASVAIQSEAGRGR